MQGLFLPQIEDYAERDPVLYEILLRMSSAIAAIPISAGGAVSATTATSGGDTSTSTGADQSAGTQVTNPNENPLYIATDPNGAASGLFLFGGSWQLISKIINDADLAPGTNAQLFLTKGKIIVGGVQFDAQGRVASPFFNNLVDAAGSPTSQPLSQSGTTTAILVAAHTWQFGDHQINYNSGSYDPGAFGTFDVYSDDPFHAGGSVAYFAVTVPNTTVIAKRGRVYHGRITTVNTGGGSGSGGGTGGGSGGKFYQ